MSRRDDLYDRARDIIADKRTEADDKAAQQLASRLRSLDRLD